MLTLILKEGGSPVTLKLEQDAINIGRAKDNEIVVKNIKASRRHARIERIGATYQITDLGSGNGTKVNGSKIDFHTLAAGDEIKIGDATLLLKSIDDEVSEDDKDADRTDLSEDTAAGTDEVKISDDDELTFKDDPPETEIIDRPAAKTRPAPKVAPPAAPPAKGAPPGAKPRPSLNDRFKKKQ